MHTFLPLVEVFLVLFRNARAQTIPHESLLGRNPLLGRSRVALYNGRILVRVERWRERKGGGETCRSMMLSLSGGLLYGTELPYIIVGEKEAARVNISMECAPGSEEPNDRCLYAIPFKASNTFFKRHHRRAVGRFKVPI